MAEINKKRKRPKYISTAEVKVEKWTRKTQSGSGQFAGRCISRQYRWGGSPV